MNSFSLVVLGAALNVKVVSPEPKPAVARKRPSRDAQEAAWILANEQAEALRAPKRTKR